MGRAIVALIDRELVSVFGGQPHDRRPVFAQQAQEELVARQEQVARREEKAAEAEERLRTWNGHLRSREVELEARERRVELAAKVTAQPREPATKRSGGTNAVRVDRGSSTSTATASRTGS